MFTTPQPLPHLERAHETQKRSGLSKSTIDRQTKDGTFPSAIPVGDRCVARISSEVDAVIAARIAGKSKEDIKALVSHLKDQRSSLLEALK